MNIFISISWCRHSQKMPNSKSRISVQSALKLSEKCSKFKCSFSHSSISHNMGQIKIQNVKFYFNILLTDKTQFQIQNVNQNELAFIWRKNYVSFFIFFSNDILVKKCSSNHQNHHLEIHVVTTIQIIQTI